MRNFSDSAQHPRYAAPAFVYPVRRSWRLLGIMLAWNALLLGPLITFMVQMPPGTWGSGRWLFVAALIAVAVCFCTLNGRWWLKMHAGCLQ